METLSVEREDQGVNYLVAMMERIYLLEKENQGLKNEIRKYRAEETKGEKSTDQTSDGELPSLECIKTPRLLHPKPSPLQTPQTPRSQSEYHKYLREQTSIYKQKYPHLNGTERIRCIHLKWAEIKRNSPRPTPRGKTNNVNPSTLASIPDSVIAVIPKAI
jgi:hypothetical protein